MSPRREAPSGSSQATLRPRFARRAPSLRREGLAREIIRIVQDGRKAAGLDVGDRIALAISAEGEAAGALDEHGDAIAAETLAVELRRGDLADATHREESALDGAALRISLRRA